MAAGHSRRELPGIQYLRGLAALMVVLFHLTLQMSQLHPGASEVPTLQSGVDIFFVISGFVMVYSTGAGAAIGPGTFIWRRLVRILPLYWAATAAMVAILLVVPQAVKSSRLDALHAALSFLFVGWPNPVGQAVVPLVTPGWTLNLEMLFYLVFAGAMMIGRRKPAYVLASAVMPLVVLSAAGLVLDPMGLAGFYLNPILLEFVYGMAAGWLLLRFDRPAVPGLVLLVPAALLVLVMPDQGDIRLRCFRYGLPALAMVSAAAFGRVRASTTLHRLGDISYSLYISHFFVLSAFAQVWRRLVPGSGPMVSGSFYVLGTAAAVGAGLLCWHVVERPLTEAVKRRVLGRDAPAPSVSLEPAAS